MHLGMLLMILCHVLNASYVRDEIRIHSQRYADRMEKHLNILMRNIMRRLHAD